jgi:hypothetical protein
MSLELLADTLHTLLCDLPHEGDMMEVLKGRKEGVCYYYLESSLSSDFSHDDHTYWNDQAKQLLSLLGVSQPAEALRSVYKVLDLIEKLNAFSPGEKELFELFRRPSEDEQVLDDELE